MTVRLYTSRSQQTTLTSAVTSGGTTINVSNASSLFATVSAASITGGATFTIVLDPDTALEEIVEVTGASSNTLTITRSVDAVGTATDHSAGAVVRHMIIGRDLRESNNHIEASSSVHGLTSTSGVVVGTAATQTLTNKTFTTPVIAGATLSGTITSTATVSGGTITGAAVTGLSAPSNGSDATTKTYVDSILGSATSAATSAASAATSASSAATSASSASTSASSAATSASSALTSQTAAATSASSAATSATAAANSATTATTQATAASTSASSASASASAASTSATSAAASASAASTSASSASTSASSAATSASSAATSASSAAASTSAAATSAASAATSATSAANSASAASTSASSASTSASSAATSANSAATSASAANTSAASAATSATAAASSATAAAASYDDFDDRYLGAKSTAPTTDNDGNPLLTGALYFNTSVNAMYVWTGSAWTVMATSGDISAVYVTSPLTGGGASGDVTVAIQAGTTSQSGAVSLTDSTASTSTTTAATPNAVKTAYDLANAALPKSTYSAKGVIVIGTGAGTYAAQTVGTDGQVLTASSGDADGVAWTTIPYVSTSGGSTITVASGTTVPLTIQNNGTGNSFVVNDEASDTSPIVFNADGQLLVGKTTANSITNYNRAIQVEGNSAATASISNIRNSVDATAPALEFGKSRGTTAGSVTAVANNDNIGLVSFGAADGTTIIPGVAALNVAVDGTVSTGVVPTRISLSTATTAGVIAERMRIDSAGNVGIGGTPTTNGKLTVNGSSRIRWDVSTSTAQEVVTNTAENAYLDKTSDALSHSFKTSGTERIKVASDGAVNIPIVRNEQTGTTYTFVLADAGKMVELNNASAVTVTVPTNASVPFPIGTQIHLLQTANGQVTVSAGSTTVNATPGLKLRALWSSATLIKRAADVWVLVGDLSA